MNDFEYSDSPYPIREDIKEAHKEYWQRLCRPGSWWTGAERIAIAEESSVDGRRVSDRVGLSEPVRDGGEVYVMQALSGG